MSHSPIRPSHQPISCENFKQASEEDQATSRLVGREHCAELQIIDISAMLVTKDREYIYIYIYQETI